MTTENETPVGYQVLVTNIFWDAKHAIPNAKKAVKIDECPVQISIDIPEQVLQHANKNKTAFNDVIEQFIYNLLYKKYGHEVNSCQIWLPLEEKKEN